MHKSLHLAALAHNAMPWLTGNLPTDDAPLCRRLLIPNDVHLVAAVSGALLQLTKPENWEKFGGLEPDLVADMMLQMYLDWLHDDCSTQGVSGMIGEVKWFATNELPANVLLCDGTIYARVDYPELYNVLPAALVMDETTFRTPQLIDRYAIGTEIEAEIGAIVGDNSPHLSVPQLPSHSHYVNDDPFTQFRMFLPFGGSQKLASAGSGSTVDVGRTGDIQRDPLAPQEALDNRPSSVQLVPGIVASEV